MKLLTDLSTAIAERIALVQGDDQRITLTVNWERRVIPDEMACDIHGDTAATWEPMTGIVNDDIGRLLIDVGIEFCRKGELTHLDGEPPTV